MKKILLLLTLLFTQTINIQAQCSETSEEKILLIGDSWAFFMHTDATFNNVLKTWGHSNYRYYSNNTLAVNGAETDDFLLPAKQNEIQTQLTNKPSIKIVHVSLAGNDFLGSWNTGYTPARLDSLQDTVNARLFSIVNFIKGIRPNIHVVISGYQYSNFEEVITKSFSPSNHPFYNRWQAMGAPNNQTVNNILNRFSDTLETKVANDPRVTFIKCTGLMQYAFGQLTPLGVAPSGTFAPLSAPLPKGFDDYPSPKTTMRNYGLFTDCFHLSIAGYKEFINYQTQKFYHKALMDDYYTLSQGGTKDGFISSTGNFGNTLSLGNTSGETFSSLLSFNTKSMKDSSISKANIFIQRSSLTGTNPIADTTLAVIKIKHGNFGATTNVELADLSSMASATETVCIYGSKANDKDWLRIDLPPIFFQHIKNDTITQFIITIPNSISGKVNYSGAVNPDFAPVLNVKYGVFNNVGINDLITNKEAFELFPNPANDYIELNFMTSELRDIKLINVVGTVIKAETSHLTKKTFNTSELSNGVYFISVKTADGKSITRKFVKS